MTSSPTKATSLAVSPSLPNISRKTFNLSLLPWWTYFEPEVASAKCHGFRVAPGDEAGLDSRDPGNRYACAILRVKAFGFDHELALGRLNGKEKKFAVGEDAVYVEEKQFDFFGAGLGG